MSERTTGTGGKVLCGLNHDLYHKKFPPCSKKKTPPSSKNGFSQINAEILGKLIINVALCMKLGRIIVQPKMYQKKQKKIC